EAEAEARAALARADVLGGVPEDLVGRIEAGQRREHAAGAALAGETVADAHPGRALDLDAELPAGAGGGAARHGVPLSGARSFYHARRRCAGRARYDASFRPARRRICGRPPSGGTSHSSTASPISSNAISSHPDRVMAWWKSETVHCDTYEARL